LEREGRGERRGPCFSLLCYSLYCNCAEGRKGKKKKKKRGEKNCTAQKKGKKRRGEGKRKDDGLINFPSATTSVDQRFKALPRRKRKGKRKVEKGKN